MSVHEQSHGESELESTPVRKIMRPGVIGCSPEAKLPSIAATMVAHGIHAIVVTPPEGGTLQVVTDLEVVRAATRGGESTHASDVAREPIATAPVDATLAAAVGIMAVRYVTHVLVTEIASSDPAGMVSSLDVAAVIGGRAPSVARLPRIAAARPSPSARRLSDAAVRDVMTPGVVTCTPEAPLWTVGRMMADHRVHSVAIAGVEHTGAGGQRLAWGLITDIDLVLAAHGGALDGSAIAIAASAPLAINEDETLERAAVLMAEHDASHLVVVGPQGLPSGLVSTLDVAAIVALGSER